MLLQEAIKDVQAVTQGAGYDDGVEASELVGKEVEVRDASAGAEIARVRAGVEGSDRNHETEPVGGSDIPAPHAVASGT